MAHPNIAVRVDASPGLGVGHLMRCLTLADELRGRGARARFLSGPLSPGHRGLVESRGHELVCLTADAVATERADALACASALAGTAWDWVVVDCYALGAPWETAMRAHAARVLAIDDLANRDHDCDALLDQNYLPDAEARYRARVPAGSDLLVGPRFALLRPEYRQYRGSLGARRREVRRLLVFFGGTDPHGMTELALEALSSPRLRELAVDVVYAGDASRRGRIEAQAALRPGTTVHGQRPHLADLMAGADLSLGGGGATSWERLCLGLRALVIIQADNQREVAAWLDACGLARLLGDAASVSAGHIHDALLEEMAHGTAHPAIEAAMQLCDGLGAPRVAEAMIAALPGGAAAAGSRKATNVV